MLIQGCLLAVWSVTSEYWKVLHGHPQEDGHQSTRLSDISLLIGELQAVRLRQTGKNEAIFIWHTFMYLFNKHMVVVA